LNIKRETYVSIMTGFGLSVSVGALFWVVGTILLVEVVEGPSMISTVPVAWTILDGVGAELLSISIELESSLCTFDMVVKQFDCGS
jgi:hypothetical protein